MKKIIFISPVEVGNKNYKRSTVPWRSPLVLVWCFRFDFELRERYLARPNFRSVPFFARPFSRESHHFAQPFLYVTFSLRDQIFAVLNFAIFSLREDKVVAKKWEFTVFVSLIVLSANCSGARLL